MTIEQIYTGCLAQGAYYIESDGQAAIIDPLRETAPYIERAKRDNATIRYVFETHFHADFVSGHLDLHKKTGATIVYGPNATPQFPAYIGRDNETFPLGKITIVLLHTPGHTMESSTYLLRDENNKDVALFTGDTLFLGDVGRPDLAQGANMTKEMLASTLYDSLMTKIMPLSDDIIVYPAHGHGSACGKNMLKQTSDSLGNQKKTNYALNQASKEDFIRAVLDAMPPPPKYFSMNVALNKQGYEPFSSILEKSMCALSVDMFERAAAQPGTILLDTRNPNEFAQGFIAGAINIGLNGNFAPWVGAILANVNQRLLLVCSAGKEEESITRLSRVGFDNVAGYLAGGMEAWKNAGMPMETISQISAQDFASQYNSKDSPIIDVRHPNEWHSQHVVGAQNFPLDAIDSWIPEVKNKQHFFVHCQSGYRSCIAASILVANGVRHFTEVVGGFKSIRETGVPVQN